MGEPSILVVAPQFYGFGRSLSTELERNDARVKLVEYEGRRTPVGGSMRKLERKRSLSRCLTSWAATGRGSREEVEGHLDSVGSEAVAAEVCRLREFARHEVHRAHLMVRRARARLDLPGDRSVQES